MKKTRMLTPHLAKIRQKCQAQLITSLATRRPTRKTIQLRSSTAIACVMGFLVNLPRLESSGRESTSAILIIDVQGVLRMKKQ